MPDELNYEEASEVDRVPTRQSYGRRAADIGPFIGAISPAWQALVVIGLAIMAGMGAQAMIASFRGMPTRMAAVELSQQRMGTILTRVDALERESATNRQMWRDVRYLVCRSREHDAGRTARGCEYLYDDSLVPPTTSVPRADTSPKPDQPIYREGGQ